MTINLKKTLLKPDIPPNIIEGFTERRRQAILQKSGALENAIFNSAHFSCIATDANGVIQIFNVGAERMLGYTAAEVINKVTLAYLSDAQEIIERAETLSIEFDTSISPGFEALVFKAARGSEDIYEHTYICKDGSRFPASVSVTALRDDQDVIIGYLLIGTDNTAHKQAEEALRQTSIRWEHLRAEEALRSSDEHYRTLFESIDEGFCIIEKVVGAAGEPLDFRYVEANPAFTTQSGVSNVVGKTIRQVIPDVSEDWLLTFDAVLTTGQAIRLEHEFGSPARVLELHAFRIKDGTHNCLGVSFHDITERKRDQMLLTAQKKVLELAASGTAIEEILEFVDHSVQQLSGDGKVLGTLPQYFTTPREPEPGEIDAVQILGQTAALVIESGRVAAQHRQSEERFRAAAGIVSSLIWANNADGLMEGEQPGWSNFTGQTQDEYQGYGWSKTVHPEDAQPTIVAWQQALAEKRIFEFAHRIRRRDGEWRLCSIRALPLLGDDGVIREWVGVHTDITERTQAEDALRASEEFNRSIINSSPDCIKVLDLEGNFLSMHNGQALLGIEDIRPFLNKSWLEFWKDDEDHQAAQAAVTVARAGSTGNFVGFFRTMRDEPKWWDVTVSPIFDAKGKPSCLLAVSRDVTSRKRTEMNLEFLASVSDDLVQSTNIEEMTRTVGAKMAAYLDLSLCAFVEIDETAEQVTISYDWHRREVPGLVGIYRLADFVGEEFLRAARAGEIVVVSDTSLDPRTDPEGFAPLKIASFISVPLIRDGQWRFALCLYHSTPYDWREDEVALTRELTARIWTRLERLQAEEALRESEERLRQALDSAELGSWNLDPATGLFTSDERFKAIFGVSVAGANEKEAVDKIHPDDRYRTQQAVTAATRPDNPAPFDIEYRVVHPDGSLHWVHAKGRAGFSGCGAECKLVSFAGTVDDITARKQAEEALIQSEERYRTLFNSIDEGFCVIEMIFDDHEKPIDYLFLEVNPAFERQSGLFEPRGKRALELVPNLEESWFELYGKIALTGEPQRISSEVKSMGVWLDLYACRVGSSDSRKVAVVFNNITERKQSEIALTRSEERFRALFDRGPIAMYTCDISGTIQEYNRGAVDLWGMEPQHGDTDEYFGGSLKWYLPDDTLMPYTQTPMAEILQGKISAAYDMEVVIERLDGSRIIVIANIVPLKNDEGEVTGAINCFYDITERKQIELNLKHAIIAAEKANRAKSHFLSNMSHELRTPLNAILGFTQLMQAESPPPTTTQAKRLQHIAKAGWYLLELINDILDLAVIEAGRINLAQENVPLTDIMVECQAMTEAQAKKHDVQINWLPCEPCWLVHADHTRVKQVILNLLSNAIKYNRPHGSVDVVCSFTSDTIRISVKDGGEGLSADQLAQLFQPFNRLGQESGAEQGTGIGLVVTKKLVELMGGKMGVESTVGIGSEFWIELRRGTSPLGETLQLDTESMQPSAQSQPAL